MKARNSFTKGVDTTKEINKICENKKLLPFYPDRLLLISLKQVLKPTRTSLSKWELYFSYKTTIFLMLLYLSICRGPGSQVHKHRKINESHVRAWTLQNSINDNAYQQFIGSTLIKFEESCSSRDVYFHVCVIQQNKVRNLNRTTITCQS